ncbi:origin of replication complex subunit 5 isoform X1 [Tripterygium wilfordii]|uniref:Origin of replication complex subunit 5 isoform X1 n=1 Tax=Tripterygium wilfordii TaxID=458696 RepID=A0A7J7E2C0_TRIWF|nr:origin of replication complex subunit 5-like [Tripterygium wilfordii]XP_038701893.1 origin of replication complex subunit 5-like [Tripterygium wilfordii]KAF5752790.1 origin of replication complex subunit 5 isoform X1 [Tripterygium wilfordii]
MQIGRRAARCSSSATTRSNAVENMKPCKSHSPTIDGLVCGGEPLNLDDLLSSFPARKIQILELLHHFGPLNSPMLPIFVYGGASTGKTSVTLQILRHLNRPFVYSSCRTCYSARILFESILNQLLLHTKNEANGYLSIKRCEKPSDFVNMIREALVDAMNNLKGRPGKSKLGESAGRANGRMIYLVFDNLELIQEWDKNSNLLPFLFNLYDVLKMPDIGLIFISSYSPDAYYTNMGYLDPIPLYFPDYTEDDIRQVFLRNQANPKLYSCFFDVVLRPFCRVTRRLDELSTAFSSLFKKYCEPLSDPMVAPNEEMKRRLFGHVQSHIAPALNEVFQVASQPSLEANRETQGRGSIKRPGSCGNLDEMEFHMSTSGKYLLISAFLASRNPATLDASLFDPKGDSDSRKRKRKASGKSLENKEIAEQDLLMKGPGTFPLERLLAIFQCITSVAEGFLEEEKQGDDLSRVEAGSILPMSDVLLQLSSLCNANFIIKGGSCPLEGTTRYHSTVSEELALKVARSLKFPLSKYLYR